MIQAADMMAEARLAAGVVLYRPEAEVLRRQFTVLDQDGVPVFACLNSGLDDAAQRGLDAYVPPEFRMGDGHNRGLGAGLNLLLEAASAAGFTHLLLFDQDSEPGPGMAAALLARWTRRTAAGARLAGIGPSLVPPASLSPAEGGYRPIRYQPTGAAHDGLVPLAFLPTSGTLIGLREARAIGPFRADYFIDGIDVEWGLRASSLGYASLLAQDVTMLHRWGEPGDEGQAQILRLGPVRRYYYLRNAIANLRLGFTPLRWRFETAARLAVQVIVLIMRGQARGVMRALRDGWSGRLGPAPDDVGRVV